jgi:DNA-directed RNA polymerase specialized sigma24 family protein
LCDHHRHQYHDDHLRSRHLKPASILSRRPDDELLALDDALNRPSTVDSRAAEMVKLCFFAGLTQEQAANELGVSVATAERLWASSSTVAWTSDWIRRRYAEELL